MESTQLLGVLLFGAIGGGLKYIDEAFDEGVFSREVAVLLAPLVVGLWIALSTMDGTSATILLAILAGVAVCGKVDNKVFQGGALALVAGLWLSGKLQVLWLPFAALTFLGVLDEKGNDYVDGHEAPKVLQFFFLHRFSMKVGCMALYGASYLAWYHVVGFLAFDTAYDAVGTLGARVALKRGIRSEGQEREDAPEALPGLAN
ncbi:MAG: hypothetical protein AABX40_02725 [Candidatus Hydrothermarchaeota archaeon]